MKVFAASLLAAATTANAYFLVGNKNTLTVQPMDPIVNPGDVSGHAHNIIGGSNFDFTLTTEKLIQSQCTTMPIKEDKSNYWFPQLYFQWANGSFTSVDGGAVIYYLYSDKPGTTKAFPPDFRMISGSPSLRSYDPNSFAQQAIDFLCLDFNGQTTKHSALPTKHCPSGIRAQINFPSCWDGKNVDSPDHKSHVAFLSDGPDRGSCKDPNFPITLPRIFLEVYWGANHFQNVRSQAKNPDQPFVFAHGDPTGYGSHADFFNGWEHGVLQRAVDECNCNIYGDAQCCHDRGIFTLEKQKKCFITPSVDTQTTGTIHKLPMENPVQYGPGRATMYTSENRPAILRPVYVYTDRPTQVGTVAIPASTGKPDLGNPAPPSPPVVTPPPQPAPSEPATNPTPQPANPPAQPAPSQPAVNPAPAPAPSAPAPAPAPPAPAPSQPANPPANPPAPAPQPQQPSKPYPQHPHKPPHSPPVVPGRPPVKVCHKKGKKAKRAAIEGLMEERSGNRSEEGIEYDIAGREEDNEPLVFKGKGSGYYGYIPPRSYNARGLHKRRAHSF